MKIYSKKLAGIKVSFSFNKSNAETANGSNEKEEAKGS